MTVHNQPRHPVRSQSLESLCAHAGVRQIDGRPVPDIEVTGLTNDSRTVERGSCFVAVKGQVVDGHTFLRQAVDAGASAVVIDAAYPFEPGGSTAVIRVGDTREAVARLAAAYYGVNRGGSHELRLVGITGTNGKSTVAWLVREILRRAGQRCALLGTIEYDLDGTPQPSALTTPDSVRLCAMLGAAYESGVRVAALEVSSHALEQRRCDGLTFDVAVFTNLSGDHLDYHTTMEAYLAAKARLFALCDDRSTALVNVDDASGRKLLPMIRTRRVCYGIEAADADGRAVIRGVSRTGSTILLQLRQGCVEVELPLVGRHNVANALAAALACESVGVDAQTIQEGLQQVAGVPGRLQRVEPDGCPFGVFVDYAHTDAALANVLDAARPITAGRLICVFGCGGDRDRTKRPRMAAAVEQGADVAVVTSDNPRSEEPETIIEEIKKGFGSAGSCVVHVDADRRAAIEWAVACAEPGDTVLIAGKGHEDYQDLGDRRIHFDDVEVARAALDGVLGRRVSA